MVFLYLFALAAKAADDPVIWGQSCNSLAENLAFTFLCRHPPWDSIHLEVATQNTLLYRETVLVINVKAR